MCILVAIMLAVGFAGAAAQEPVAESDRILGTWLTEDGKAHIEITRTGETFAGRIVWLKEPEKNGRPAVDDKNPDESLRTRPILGLELMYGFVYDGGGEWVGGRVYDPEGGDEYRGKLSLEDDKTMELRGYIMIPLFGRSETWKRVR